MTDSRSPENIKETVLSVIDKLERSLSGKTLNGLLNGFADWDLLTGGLNEGELIVIAARPCLGKTTLALNLVENLSLKARTHNQIDANASGQPVAPGAIFSLQNSSESLVKRLICSRSGIGFTHLKSNMMVRSNQAKFLKAASEIAEAPIWIDDSPRLTIEQFIQKATELKEKHDIRYIVIDLIQKLRAPQYERGVNRELEISEISSEIKQTARTLGVPIIALSQLNRSADSRCGLPRMTDLRGSSAIEDEADQIGILIRNEYYSEIYHEGGHPDATLMIVKNRTGPTGDIPLVFDRELYRFSGWVP